MEKRVILAFALSFVVLYAYTAFVAPPAQPTGVSTAPAEPPVPPSPAEAAPPIVNSERSVPVDVEELNAEKAEDFTFDTPLYSVTVSNAGASLKSFKLKNYTNEEGSFLELIDPEVANSTGWPLALISGDKDIDDKLRNALFVAKPEKDRVVLEFAGGGIYARKALQFDQESHEFTLETQLAKDGKPVPHNVVWQGSFGDQSKDSSGVPLARDPAKKFALYQVDAAFTRVGLTSLTKDPQAFSTRRAGVEDQYFVAMFRSMTAPLSVKIANQESTGSDAKPAPSIQLSVARTQDEPLQVYVGPKQQDWLSKADPELAAVQDFGYFEFIAKPLLQGLHWVHRYIGNYGWAIVILTVALNLAIFPLKLKQQFAMLKMQKIQPQMRRLQDQYKKLKANDPRRTQVQSEMMGLYKQHGVNPMGGCLPLLLQMPFFFGFYSALAYAIELRRAPWILWIKDLSTYDPSYMLPILVAVAMVVQQKLTPMANLDPAQARMMMLMPIVMTFMFLSVSSGLALYWLTGSVVGIGQQVFMNKYWSPKAEAKIGRSSPKEPKEPKEPRGA